LDRPDEIVLIEVETRIRALEAIIRECAEKRASLAESVRSDRTIHVVLVLPPTRHHRALLRAHPAIVAAAFPSDSGSLARALAEPGLRWPGDGILWMSGEDHSRPRVS
jgi:hypothetical protein